MGSASYGECGGRAGTARELGHPAGSWGLHASVKRDAFRAQIQDCGCQEPSEGPSLITEKMQGLLGYSPQPWHTQTHHTASTHVHGHTCLFCYLSSPSVPDPMIFTRSFEVRVLLRHHRAAELLDVIGLTWPGFCSHWLRQRNLRLETQWDLCMVMEGHRRLCKVMQGHASPQPGSGLSQLNQQPYCIPKTLISFPETTCQVDHSCCAVWITPLSPALTTHWSWGGDPDHVIALTDGRWRPKPELRELIFCCKMFNFRESLPESLDDNSLCNGCMSSRLLTGAGTPADCPFLGLAVSSCPESTLEVLGSVPHLGHTTEGGKLGAPWGPSSARIPGWVLSPQKVFTSAPSTSTGLARLCQRTACSLRFPRGNSSILSPRTPPGTNPGGSGRCLSLVG